MPIQLSKEIGANFCYAPWTNIHINTQGIYKTCCAGTAELDDLRIKPIQDIINSSTLIELKKNIFNNIEDKNCSICKRQETMSHVSERAWYDEISQTKKITLNSLNDLHLQNLDIRWSNTCNLSCVYCGPEASSQWAILKKIPISRIDYTDTLDSILNLIETNKESLKNIALLGGEPLLQKENNLLLDIIPENVSINIITNLNVPLANNKIFEKLLTKKNVVWDISFDTVEEKFEYVRHGASWTQQIENIRYLQKSTKDFPKHFIGVAGVYSVYNALNLVDLHKYFKNHNLPEIRWTELHYPSILSVSSLPDKFRIKAARELEDSIVFHESDNQKNFLLEMSTNLIRIKNDTENCSELYRWHEEQEHNYWSDFKYKFKDLWPEYLE